MTTYVFTACDKHNVKRFSLTSVTETLTGKSWIKRLQNTQSEAAARRDVNHLKKTPEELSRSDFWRRPRNAFGNGMQGLGKSVRDTSHLLAQQLEVGWVSGLWVGNKKMLKLLRLWKLNTGHHVTNSVAQKRPESLKAVEPKDGLQCEMNSKTLATAPPVLLGAQQQPQLKMSFVYTEAQATEGHSGSPWDSDTHVLLTHVSQAGDRVPAAQQETWAATLALTAARSNQSEKPAHGKLGPGEITGSFAWRPARLHFTWQ